MKILFVSDLHGNLRAIDKLSLLNVTVDVLIIGGDVTATHFVPIINYGKMIVLKRDPNSPKFNNEKDAIAYKELLIREGFIGWYGTAKEFYSLDKKKYILEIQKKSFRMVLTKLKKRYKKIFLILGNDDNPELENLINEEKSVINLNERVVEFEGCQFLGMSFVPPTPFKSNFEISEDKILKKINRLMKKVKSKSYIWVFHSPPKNSGLDICLKLDENLNPVYKGGWPVFDAVGSKSISKALRLYKPHFLLCGHVHESPGIRKIENTICINPGSEAKDGLLRLTLIDTETEKTEMWKI